MARSQNASRGRFAKKNFVVTASGKILFSDYSNATALVTANATGMKVAGGIKLGGRTSAIVTGNSTGVAIAGGIKLSTRTSAVVTGNSTGIVLAGGLKVSNKQHITANSTGFAFGSVATKPSARSATNKWAFMKSAAGTGYICINTTGTTWKYVQVTSTLNTTSGYA